ncbi:hypothetical protein RRG08_026777 [Elysia crispata]|uniref:Uncharacterized protein n=1 Tax=Elysia crispata TaxID=231223 RepID=A0AAE1AQ43_9GAST|nr:hypothetical protein RRG08_026777 [Elysia crispata]
MGAIGSKWEPLTTPATQGLRVTRAYVLFVVRQNAPLPLLILSRPHQHCQGYTGHDDGGCSPCVLKTGRKNR